MKNAKLFKAIVSMVMVLSLLVGCSMMFAGCNNTADDTNNGDKNNAAQYEGLEKEEYLQKLESNNLSTIVDSFTGAYEKLFSATGVTTVSGGAKMDVTLTMGDTVLEMLEGKLFGGDIGDMSFLSKINLSMDFAMDEDLEKIKMSLGLNNQQIVSAIMLMNMAESVMYVALPEMSDEFIKMDMGSEDMPNSVAGVMSSPEMLAALAEALPDGDTLNTLLSRYLDLILSGLNNVEQTTDTLELEGLSQECTVLTLKIYEEDALKIVKSVLNTAKDDQDMKKVIENFAQGVEDIAADEAYTDFQEAVTDLLADLEEETEFDTVNPIVINTYVDKDHNIIGRELIVGSQGELRSYFGYYEITDGDNFAVKIDANDGDMTLTGKGTKADGKTNATYDFSVQGTSYATAKVENWTEDGGTVTVTPNKDLLTSLFGGELPFENLALQIKIAEGIELNIVDGSDLLLGIALKVAESDGPNVSEPSDAVDGMDSNAMQAWAEKLAVDVILDNLEKAGVPSDLIDSIVDAFNEPSQDTTDPSYSWPEEV